MKAGTRTLSFRQKLDSLPYKLRKTRIEVLQVNLGKLCNMTCSHCHVEAGPRKTKENMNTETASHTIRLMDHGEVTTLDLTGGAPELNPNFKKLVQEARKRDIHVIDRCNLTVLFEPGQEGLGEFLAHHRVEIVASLPCYSKENVDEQRGRGAFDKSIRALLFLNQLGYGHPETDLKLNLVYNPVGPHLPPPQKELEKKYKERLQEDFGIIFNSLYTITNMPITRYQKYLKAKKQLEDYRELLYQSFNAATLEGLMCRNTLSVGWDGRVYDCDFNQMLGMDLKNKKSLTLRELDLKDLKNRDILMADHCYGCTAGSGSSCQGALSS